MIVKGALPATGRSVPGATAARPGTANGLAVGNPGEDKALPGKIGGGGSNQANEHRARPVNGAMDRGRRIGAMVNHSGHGPRSRKPREGRFAAAIAFRGPEASAAVSGQDIRAVGGLKRSA